MKLALACHALADDAAALKACREAARLQPTNEEANRLILKLALSAPETSGAAPLRSGLNVGAALSGTPARP